MSKFKETAGRIDKRMYAVYSAFKNDETPLYAKIACGMCVWYALSPLDLVPDFIPVLGAVDDFLIMPLLIWLAVKLMPADIMKQSMLQAEEIWAHGRQSKKRYALPIIAIWLILAMWIGHILYKYFL